MRASHHLAIRSYRADAAPAWAFATAALAVALVLSGAWSAPALGAAPAPCGGVAQIADGSGDGHHINTDVLSAWFSEQNGRLQAVIKVNLGLWESNHDRATDTAGFAVLFEVAGQRRYVRVEGPPTSAPQSAPAVYDHGTWTLAGGVLAFASQGATVGEVTTGSGGTATIDVPVASGAVPGALLVRPFVMTYDGPSAASQHWVDRAPGGVTPTEAAFGADYVVGSCGGGDSGGGGGTGPGGENPGASGTATTTAVVLTAPKRLTGAGRVRAGGRVVPARGGVTVRVTAKPRHSRRPATVRSVTTSADGSFAATIALSETSTVTAVAEGINAQTTTVTVRSTIRLNLRRLPDGRTVASGLVSPRLPGRILLLRTNAVAPSATAQARDGRFRVPARRLRPGRYQAVFIPNGNRAERSTSRSGAVR